VRFPRAAVLSVVFAVAFTVALWLLQPYVIHVPVKSINETGLPWWLQ